MKPLILESPQCRLVVHPLGATVLSYVPTGQQDLLFVSPTARFEVGTGIRGGIPICWPWFATHPEPGFPSHGVARTRVWTLEDSRADDIGCYARWSLEDDNETRELTPPFRFELEIRATDSLELILTHHHRGSRPVSVTGALHSYLAVQDAAHATIHGLDQKRFYDKNQGAEGVQRGPLDIDGPTDLIFYDADTVELHADPSSSIQGSGRDVVVWNPAQALGDLPTEDHHRFVCVETAQIQPLELAPGDTATLRTRIYPRWSRIR